jgi:hypothetical protein
LALNFDQTNYTQFSTKNKTYPNLNISFGNKLTEEVEGNKFLRPQNDNNLKEKH